MRQQFVNDAPIPPRFTPRRNALVNDAEITPEEKTKAVLAALEIQRRHRAVARTRTAPPNGANGDRSVLLLALVMALICTGLIRYNYHAPPLSAPPALSPAIPAPPVLGRSFTLNQLKPWSQAEISFDSLIDLVNGKNTRLIPVQEMTAALRPPTQDQLNPLTANYIIWKWEKEYKVMVWVKPSDKALAERGETVSVWAYCLPGAEMVWVPASRFRQYALLPDPQNSFNSRLQLQATK